MVAVGHEEHDFYKLDTTLGATYALVSQSISKDQLWHERLGHLNLESIKLMLRKNMVYGLPKILVGKCLCKSCLMGKHHWEPFQKGKAWRAQNLL